VPPYFRPGPQRRRHPAAAGSGGLISGAGQRKFYADDPIAREPETKDALGGTARDIHLSYDLGLNLFTRPGDRAWCARRTSTQSTRCPTRSWFTNRILARPMSIEELTRGPTPARACAGRLDGDPGEAVRRESGIHHTRPHRQIWFVQFDASKYDQAASARPWWPRRSSTPRVLQTENYISELNPKDLTIDPRRRSIRRRDASGR